MSVTVRLYAGVKEAAGVAELTVEGETISEVSDALAATCPAIAERLPYCRFVSRDRRAMHQQH